MDSAECASAGTLAEQLPHRPSHGGERPAWHLVIGALGVVYGDVGTSPIYTLREAFGETGKLAVTPEISSASCR